MKTPKMTLGIVIPAYRPDLEKLIPYIKEVQSGVGPEEIRVELDEPRTETLAQLNELDVEINSVSERRGKGSAVTSGFNALSTDIYAFIDSDGATRTESVKEIIEPIQNGNADVSVGSRRHPNSHVNTHQTKFRRFLGNGYAWLARRLIGPALYDYQCGAKAVTAEQWRQSKDYITEKGFAWDINFLAVSASQGAIVEEIPIVWEDQSNSTVNPIRDTLDMFVGLIRAFYRTKFR